MKIKKVYYTLIFILLFNIRAFASDPPMPPPIDPSDDGSGGSGTGAPSSPIDMYIYALIFVGILFILYFANKKQKNIA